MALCTRKQVKDFLGITGVDAVADTKINDLITGVSSIIETYCGRVFELTEHTEYYDGHGDDTLYTQQSPITTVSGIWEDVNREWGVDTVFEPSDYIVLEDRVLLKGYYFNRGKTNIKIIYSAGYETIPADIAQVAVQEVARAYKHNNNLGVFSSTTMDSVTTNFITDAFLPQSVIVLDSYKGLFVV